GRVVDRVLARAHAAAARARAEPGRRLAARRAQPEAAPMSAPHIDQMNAGGGVPLLSVRKLRIEFPGRRGTLVAIDDVSFDIARGEILGMVGESGAGKSLTGAAIIGLLEPPGRIAGGEILLHGEPIHSLPPAAMREIRGRRIAMIFQDPLTSLNPLFTIGQQLTETILAHLDIGLQAA